MKKNNTINLMKGLLYTILAVFLAGTLINCGGGSSGSAQVQAPTALIQDFIAKHVTMVDTALVNFYVKSEQASMAAAVQKTIEEKTAAGELEALQHATFDFSNTQITLVDQKEAYVNDEPKTLIKVAVSGTFLMKEADKTETISANDTIILEMINNTWKVTEKINPWS